MRDSVGLLEIHELTLFRKISTSFVGLSFDDISSLINYPHIGVNGLVKPAKHHEMPWMVAISAPFYEDESTGPWKTIFIFADNYEGAMEIHEPLQKRSWEDFLVSFIFDKRGNH